MDQDGSKLWTKEFAILFAIQFCVAFLFFLLIVTMASITIDQYRASESLAGLVSGIYILGALVARLIVGRFVDSLDPKKILLAGLALMTLDMLFYFPRWGISFLLVNRLFHGMTVGVALTVTGAVVSRLLPESRKGEGIGYFSLSGVLGSAFGPFIGLYLMQHADYNLIYGLCFALGVISLVCGILLRLPEAESPDKPQVSAGFRLSDYIEPNVLPLGVVVFGIALGWSSVLSFINLYASETNLVNAASFFFMVYSVSVIASRPVTGRIMDARGANVVIYPAFVLYAAGLLLFGTARSGAVLLLAGLLLGLGFGNLQSIANTIAVKSAPQHRMGRAVSTFFVTMEAGMGIGPYLLGFLIPILGFRNLYVILAILMLAISGLYHVLHGRKETRGRMAIRGGKGEKAVSVD